MEELVSQALSRARGAPKEVAAPVAKLVHLAESLITTPTARHTRAARRKSARLGQCEAALRAYVYRGVPPVGAAEAAGVDLKTITGAPATMAPCPPDELLEMWALKLGSLPPATPEDVELLEDIIIAGQEARPRRDVATVRQCEKALRAVVYRGLGPKAAVEDAQLSL